MEKNILLTIEYDGTCFSGWQRQPGIRTVQGELESVLSDLCRQEIKIDGTSRTDAGVHALGQRASFSGDFGIPAERIAVAANNMLAAKSGSHTKCSDVRIIRAEEVPADFHARFNSRGKKYRYIIDNSSEPDIFSRNYCYHVKEKLDTDLMNKAASYITGTHDFACFQSAGGNVRLTTVRTVHSLTVTRQGEKVIIEITGDGFLYNMVRIITGTLVEAGTGRRNPDDVAKVIESCDRQKAGHTAPAEGLYLVEIYY